MLAPNIVSLPSLISWLRTKDPEEAYDYSSHTTCCFAQYLDHRGCPYLSQERLVLFEQLHKRYMDVANPIRGLQPQPHDQARGHPRLGWTFGKALERALQMQEASDNEYRRLPDGNG